MSADDVDGAHEPAGTPAVSVVVLSYDRPGYLRTALESVAAQTDPSFEVVIADDCSPDPAVDAVLEEFRGRFERYVYERPEKNVGVVANLLRAVGRTSGRYVAVLCDDDAFEPGFVARLSRALDAAPNACAAFCNVRIIDERGEVDSGETALFDRRWSRENVPSGTLADLVGAAIVKRMFQPAMGAMLRKSALDWHDFPEQVAGGWDTWVSYLCARGGMPAIFVAEPLFRYRQHPAALTARRDMRWYRGLIHIYERCRDDRRITTIDAVIRERLERYHTELGMALLRHGRHAEAGRTFRSGLEYGKAPKLWAGSFLSRLPVGATQAMFRFYDR